MAVKSYPFKNIYPPSAKVRALVAADLWVVSKDRLKRLPDRSQVGREYDAMFAVLQGLANRDEPRVYLSFGHPQGPGTTDKAWLEYLEERFNVPVRRLDTPFELFDEFGDLVSGAILYDTEEANSINLAVMLAGRKNCLPITAEMQDELKDKYPWAANVEEDLRGRFANDYELNLWAHENIQPDCYPHIVVHQAGIVPFIYDYVVAHNLFVFHSPHMMKNRKAVALTNSVYQAMARPGHVMGWLDKFTPELEYTARIAKNGCFETCNGPAANLSVFAGIDATPQYTPRELTPRQKEVEKKVYVTYVASDGDALWCLSGFFFGNFNGEGRGDVPLAWEMQSLCYHLAPAMLQYYIDRVPPNDVLVASTSGAGYTYPNLHPDPASYLQFTEEYLKLTGIRTVFAGIHNPYEAVYWRDTESDRRKLAELYRKHVPSAVGVVRGYSGGAFLEGNSFEADAAPFVCFTTGTNAAEKILPETLKAIEACDKRPLFVSVHLTNTQGDVNTALREAADALAAQGCTVVALDEWFAKIRAAAKKGWLDDGMYPDRQKHLARLREENRKSWRGGTGKTFEKMLRKCLLPDDELEKMGDDFPAIWGSGQPRNEKSRTFSTLEEDLGFTVLFTGQIMSDAAVKCMGVYEHDLREMASFFETQMSHVEDIAVLCECLRAWLRWEKEGPTTAEAKDLARRMLELIPRLDREFAEGAG